MAPLKNENNRENCSKDITHGQPIVSMPYVDGNEYNLTEFNKEELHVEENIVLKEYGEVKEENIEISEEVYEGLVIEEELEIKIVEEINEDPIIEKDLKVEIVETIKEEIIEEVVNDHNEIKLDDCNIQTLIILLGDTETKFIDFIGWKDLI
ncbi:hypothetical protein SO802_023183 [Lithocarpus litseifolius]|uniref:Uncharacterized protein n=1 Tax=Lithocarpus litseifolius TaxID=425828 RepID=A0AAW2CAZ9_9ROSI